MRALTVSGPRRWPAATSVMKAAGLTVTMMMPERLRPS